MKELLVLNDITRLQMIARRLEGEGIVTTIRNESVADNVYPSMLVPSFSPRLFILDDADHPRALQLLRRFKAELEAPAAPDRPCPHCGEPNPGNFSSCWNCQKSL